MCAKSRILLIGGGGVGVMTSYALEKGGKAQVTALLRSNYDIAKQQGFSIDSIEHGNGITNFRPTSLINKIPQMAAGAQEPFDYIIVSTKNIPDVSPTVADLIEPAMTPGKTSILLLQNGLNIEKPVIARFPNNVVLSGVSLISATEDPPGHVKHDFNDSSNVGPFSGLKVSYEHAEAEARRLVDMYNACGKVNWKYDSDVAYSRWRKLIYNSSFNSVSAILGMGVIQMRQTQHIIDDLVRPIMYEVIAIAKAAGIYLPENIVMETIKIDPIGVEFTPSMGQDARKGNLIEMENIVGEPLREAERLGVPAPVLRTMYGLLKGYQVKIKERMGLWNADFGLGNPYKS